MLDTTFRFFSRFLFFLVYLGKHIVCPLVRQRNFLNNPFHLCNKIFLSQIFFITWLLFLGATIIVVSFLFLGGYEAVAISTFHQARKSKFVFSLAFLFSSITHYLLDRIKKFLGNIWLVRSVINFTVERKYTVVNLILQ